MRGQRRTALVVVAALIALAAAAVVPAPSSGRSLESKIEGKRRHLDRVNDRAGDLQANISSINKKVSGLRGEISSLQRKENRARIELQRRESELEKATARYDLEHRRFVRLRAELKRTQHLLAQRLVRIYKSDRPDITTVLLQSDGFEEMLARSEYIDKVNSSDAKIVTRVKTLKAQSERKRAQLVDLKRQAAVAVDAIENKKRELSNTRGKLSARRSDLTKARSKQKSVLGGVRQERNKLEGDLSKMSAQVEAQLGGGGIAGPIRKGSGQMIWPVNGPITSPFCERRSWESCHPGIDIGASGGTGIRAADDGTVALAGPTGGYGNYTCINHGGGLSSCYAHQSSIQVSVGQSVSKGQVIGLVGCTGLCFGDHLHFEVRVNGAVQSPLSYL